MDFQDLENLLFDIKVRKKITMASMRDYIEIWLKKALTKITEPNQEEEVVVTDQEGLMKENIKDTPERK